MTSMISQMELVVDSGGDVRCIYDEALDLRERGKLQITRASPVEPDRDGFWWADMGPVDGPVLGPFWNRTEALQAEREWLANNMGSGATANALLLGASGARRLFAAITRCPRSMS
jgi:hypothetical protein